MLRLVVASLTLALVGCATPVSSVPPDSRITVAESVGTDVFSTARVVVVVGEVVVTDPKVPEHLGGTVETASATYRDFFAQRLPLAFMTAQIATSRVLSADQAGVALTRPADGTRLDIPGDPADVVLLLDTLHVRRSIYYREAMGPPAMGAPGQAPGAPTTQRFSETGLRLDTNMVLWDNTQGREIASGRLESETKLGLLSGPLNSYRDAVREFVEQLARFTPLTLRD